MNTGLSFNSFREEDPSNYSDEVVELYSRKEDSIYKKDFNIDAIIPHYESKNYDFFLIKSIFWTPKDPYYMSLTNEERIEKGLPAKFEFYIRHYKGLFVTSGLLFSAFLMHSMSRGPDGIIIQRNMKSRYAYNLPILTLFGSLLYYTYIFELKRYINYKDDSEKSLDAKLAEKNIKF